MKEVWEDAFALAPWNVGAGDLYNANTFALALHRLRDGARLCCSEHANPITASLRFSLTYAFATLQGTPHCDAVKWRPTQLWSLERTTQARGLVLSGLNSADSSWKLSR